MNALLTVLHGHWIDQLRTLPDACCQMCVTSPPYFGLRSYLPKDSPLKHLELGSEATPQEYIEHLVEGFREVRRVLKKDGTLWLNISDTYAGGGNGGGGSFAKDGIRCPEPGTDKNKAFRFGKRFAINGIKPKDLIGIPWMLAFALRDDGWWLRSEITWLKRAPMPESVTDRPASATEKIFLLAKSYKYFYDAAAVRQPSSESFAQDRRWQTGSNNNNLKLNYESNGAQNPKRVHRMFDKQRGHALRHAGFNDRWDHMTLQQQRANGCNLRNYWLLGPEPFKGEHYASFPCEVPRRAILAGSRAGDTVLDPFLGSGTTAKVAIELGRKCIGIELNPNYLPIISQRTATLQLPLCP